VRDWTPPGADALHFPKLVDRFVQNLRRCDGFRVQYFAVIEPQARLAPHLHLAIRGVVPRAVLKQVIEATYASLWWPPFDRPVYVHRQPVWTGTGYCDADTGQMLPTWAEALDQVADDPDTRPMHVLRLGAQYDAAGIIAPSEDADRAVRYLAKYLPKAVADPLGDHDPTPAREQHIDRLHAELRWLPCSPRCANWLCYGIQPDQPGPGFAARRCSSKAHNREHLGVVAVASSSPATGPARPSPNTKPTAPLSSAKPSTPPASSPPRSNGWPPPCSARTVCPASSGPMSNPTPPATPSPCSAPSPNGSAGGPNTSGQSERLSLWTTVRQPAPTRRLPMARPHPMTRQDQGRRGGSQV
jgi:hypothetical protein